MLHHRRRLKRVQQGYRNKDRQTAMGTGPAGGRSAGDRYFGVTSVAAPKAASSRTAKARDWRLSALDLTDNFLWLNRCGSPQALHQGYYRL